VAVHTKGPWHKHTGLSNAAPYGERQVIVRCRPGSRGTDLHRRSEKTRYCDSTGWCRGSIGRHDSTESCDRTRTSGREKSVDDSTAIVVLAGAGRSTRGRSGSQTETTTASVAASSTQPSDRCTLDPECGLEGPLGPNASGCGRTSVVRCAHCRRRGNGRRRSEADFHYHRRTRRGLGFGPCFRIVTSRFQYAVDCRIETGPTDRGSPLRSGCGLSVLNAVADCGARGGHQRREVNVRLGATPETG